MRKLLTFVNLSYIHNGNENVYFYVLKTGETPMVSEEPETVEERKLFNYIKFDLIFIFLKFLAH